MPSLADKDIMDMDLVTGLSGLQQAKTASNVQYAVARKVLDAQRAEGAGAIQMLQAATQGMSSEGGSASNPAASLGLGTQLDATA